MRRIVLCLLGLACVAAPVALAAPAADEPDGFLGVLLSGRSLDLAPAVDGKLREVRVRLGDPVHAGDVVAALDDADTSRELEAAEADLEAADASLAEARTRAAAAEEAWQRRARVPEIHSEEEIRDAEEQLELARAGADRAAAGVRQQQAVVDRLRERRARMRLVAPFDGNVAARYRNEGDAAGPSRPVVRLVGSGTLWTRFAVPLDRAAEVTPGRAIRVRVDGLDLVLDATVRHVASEIDTASGMVLGEATVTPPASDPGVPLAGRKVRVSLAP